MGRGHALSKDGIVIQVNAEEGCIAPKCIRQSNGPSVPKVVLAQIDPDQSVVGVLKGLPESRGSCSFVVGRVGRR